MLQMSMWRHLYVWSSFIPRPRPTHINMCVVHPLLTLTPLLTRHSKHTVQFEMLKTLTDEVDTANLLNFKQ